MEFLQRDFSRGVGQFLVIFGGLNLLGLNLFGFVWIHLGQKLKNQDESARKWAVRLLLLLCGIIVVLTPATIMLAADQVRVSAFWYSQKGAPEWVIAAIGLFGLIVCLVPLILLETPGTKRACQ